MTTPIYSGMGGPEKAGPGFVPGADDAVNPAPPGAIEAQVEALVEARISAIESKYASRVKALEDQLEATQARLPVNFVPEHAGGPGHEIVGSWGLMHQEMARAGTLTPEILEASGMRPEQIAAFFGG
jgi:hypothetical protein